MKTNMKINFKPNENFSYYLYWIDERMKIFWNRMDNKNLPPYTKNEILAENKFTNVYRSLDRVSQHLINQVIYTEDTTSPDDTFMRIILFKHFNKIETWEYLESELGKIGFNTDLNDIIDLLDERVKRGNSIYNPAFMLTAAFMRKEATMQMNGLKKGDSKHFSYLKIFEKELFERGKMENIKKSNSLKELYSNISSVMSMGPFLSMQYAIDFNYSELFDFDENEFIIAGPGAINGINRTFDFDGKPFYEEVIHWVKDNFEDLCKDYGYEPNLLPGRKPALIDLQNCFCETDKMLRVMGKSGSKEVSGTRMKSKFKAEKSFEKPKINYKLPPKWNVKF